MSSPSAADVAELAVPLLGVHEEDEADHDEVTAAEDADAAEQPGDLEQGLNSAPASEAGGSKAEDEAAYEVGSFARDCCNCCCSCITTGSVC